MSEHWYVFTILGLILIVASNTLDRIGRDNVARDVLSAILSLAGAALCVVGLIAVIA